MSHRLSICIVVRNAATGLELTFRSLRGQIRELETLGCELVIVDGESEDGSLAVARAHISSLPASIGSQLISQPPKGIYAAMNAAWQRATSPWLLFLNAGDLLLHASYLADGLDLAEVRQAASIQFGAAIFPPGCRVGAWIPKLPLACHQALVYQRDLHTQFGPYDERLLICADTLFMKAFASLRRHDERHLLSATEVSPANASRDPDRVSMDLATVDALQLPIDPWPRRRLTLLLLGLERRLGFSLSVWLRLALAMLIGQARIVRLG